MSLLSPFWRRRARKTFRFFKQTRIAEIERAESFGEKFSPDYDFGIFPESQPVLRISEALRLIGFAVPVHHTRIHEIQPSVRHERAARKTAVFIYIVRRRKRGRKMFPPHEVGAAHVSPVHRPPFRGIRMILKERVIIPFEKDQTVRIIYPTLLSRDVKFLSLHKITLPLEPPRFPRDGKI